MDVSVFKGEGVTAKLISIHGTTSGIFPRVQYKLRALFDRFPVPDAGRDLVFELPDKTRLTVQENDATLLPYLNATARIDNLHKAFNIKLPSTESNEPCCSATLEQTDLLLSVKPIEP